jgi:DNA-binding beta-propeller fold protein YncE
MRKTMNSMLRNAFALVLLAIAPAFASGYHIVSKVPVPGDGGWDLVTCDSQARRLYISHSTQTQIMDIDQLKLVGQVEGTNGVHGIALAPELGRGFITAGRDNRVMIIDLKTLKSLGTVPTGENPDVILYDPASGRVFAFNGRADSATIFKAATGEPLVTLPLGGKPEFGVADGHGSVFVNLEDKNQLVKINSRAMAVEQRWPLAPCEEPSSMALDSATARLFIGCGNKTLVAVDASTGKVVANVPIGGHVDATVFDPEAKLVITSNGEGTLTVIHEDTPDAYQVVQTVPTQQGARTLSLDTMTHRLFLPVAALGPPPPPTSAQPHPRPSIVPGTFAILVIAP